MIERHYDPSKPYRFVRYGRMSDPQQNKRSPDQQFATIDEVIARNKYPWQCIVTYRDDGISGRFVMKRPGFQKMIRDITVGLIKPDLIVVDTFERFGRAQELEGLRQKLRTDFGVLIVTADSNFSDPTGIVGKAVGMVESVRSTEDSRVKAHNVLRGKKDAIRLKRWPGGPVPQGLRPNRKVDNSGKKPRFYSTLEPNPENEWLPPRIFEKAAETGWGRTRMAKWFNLDPEIPEQYKPISEFTIGYILANEIYIGNLVWNKHSTDVVNDARVIERNPEEEFERISDFCQPIVDVALFQRVQALTQLRSAASAAARAAKGRLNEEKLIEPLSRGLVLKHVLTGLVVCGHCGARMRPVPSRGKGKAGQHYHYLYYACPLHGVGACENGQYVSEAPLRDAVISRLRSRLFPLNGSGQGQVPEWFPGFVERIDQELAKRRPDQPGKRAVLEAEIKKIDEQLAGWQMTLGNRQLAANVRCDFEVLYAAARTRKADFEAELGNLQAQDERAANLADPEKVLARLSRLSDVLAANNPTLGNIELAMHIDRIEVFEDGRLMLRGTMLGLFEGATEILNQDDTSTEPFAAKARGRGRVRPRRLPRRRTNSLSSGSLEMLEDVEQALDPNRFAGVAGKFFWEEEFYISRKLCWAEEHAMEVARARTDERLTHERLAERFGKTIPTIRHALRLAGAADESINALPRKIARRRWHEDHADEVAKLWADGKSISELEEQFDKSDTTIRAAIKHAKRLSTPEQA
jgi:DNA invertase Pin-like site-specific DNA recombinase